MPEYPGEAPDAASLVAHTHAESDVTNLGTDLAAKAAKASNLSDLASAATARTNLGLGTAAQNATGDFLQKADATAKGGLWVATGNGSYAFHPAGNDGEVAVWDASATDGVRNAALSDAKAYNDLLGWSFDPTNGVSALTLVAANLYLARIPLRRQISVTNIIAHLAVVGVSLTHAFGLVYKSDGTVLGQTVDYSSNWIAAGSTIDGNATGVGLKKMVLSGGPFTATPLAANDFLWGALYVGTLGTAPQFFRHQQLSNGNVFINVGTTGARSRSGLYAVADTATPGSITPASVGGTSVVPWMGIS